MIPSDMRFILFLTLFFVTVNRLHSQQIEFSSGLCTNSFFDGSKRDLHHYSNYDSKSGYSISLAMNMLAIDSLPLRFSLRYTDYGGAIFTTNGGVAFYTSTNASVHNQCLGADIFILNFKIKSKLNLNLGLEINYLLKEKLTGYIDVHVPPDFDTIPFDKGTIQLGNQFYGGIVARVGYEVDLSKYYYLIPQYQIFVGLTPEFDNLEMNTRSVRHYLEIGIGRRITQ